jgi:hypothetical protein
MFKLLVCLPKRSLSRFHIFSLFDSVNSLRYKKFVHAYVIFFIVRLGQLHRSNWDARLLKSTRIWQIKTL